MVSVYLYNTKLPFSYKTVFEDKLEKDLLNQNTPKQFESYDLKECQLDEAAF